MFGHVTTLCMKRLRFFPHISFTYLTFSIHFSRTNLKNGQCLLLMIWYFNFQRMNNCKNRESFCLRILTIDTNDWSTWVLTCLLLPCFFSLRFLNTCKPGTAFYLVRWVACLACDYIDDKSRLVCKCTCLSL